MQCSIIHYSQCGVACELYVSLVVGLLFTYLFTSVHTFSSHPYIFFNEDKESITFVGFMVAKNGDLVDPVHRTVLESAIMRSQLYTGLKQNRVNFDEDYRGWSKDQMITKIATVMGLDFPYDPDDTYVLTTDNLIKMLAIQMRFRCVFCVDVLDYCYT